MDFNYSENQTIISETIKDFSKREIVPYMNEWDEKQIFPIELFKKIGNLGMMGVLVPEEYGGSGLSYDEYVTIISELSKEAVPTNTGFPLFLNSSISFTTASNFSFSVK